MIPPTPTRGTKSAAEKKVFAWLSDAHMGSSAVGFHSLNLTKVAYKRLGEADFVILTPEALIVLEVKGGGVSVRDGIWVYTDRFGDEHRRSESPFQQAGTCMFGLERKLRDTFGSTVADSLVYCRAVVFPDAPFSRDSPEWDAVEVIDEGAFASGQDASEWLHDVVSHWRAKSKGRSGLDIPTWRRLRDFLRGDFDLIPSLRARAGDIDVQLENLTEEQFRTLDALEEIDKLIIEGGAGTGKTFLAAEDARRHDARGRSVRFVCPSPQLASYVARRLDGTAVEILVAGEACDGDPVDVMIVDEAQDFMSLDGVAALGALVRGGLEQGAARLFMDPNKQVLGSHEFDPQVLELLVEDCGFQRSRLKRNCRNTPEIVSQTQLYTGGDLGIPNEGSGPAVDFRDVDAGATEAAVLDEVLKCLLEDHVPLGEITILSPSGASSPAVLESRYGRRKKLARISDDVRELLKGSELTWATIDEFRGLENKFVILTNLDDLAEGEPGVNELYVAMSRARASLTIILSSAARDRLLNMAPAGENRGAL